MFPHAAVPVVERERANQRVGDGGLEVEYSGPCELSADGAAFVAGTAHLLDRGDVYIEGWYGFVESPTFEWDAVPPRHAVTIRLPSGSVGDITIDNYTPGAMLVRVEGSGPGPWRAPSRSARS